MKIPAEWLTHRVEHAPTSYHFSSSPVAALRVRSAWQKLKRQAETGDEMWAFSSPSNPPNKRARYSGYALVRDGVVAQSTMVVQD